MQKVFMILGAVLFIALGGATLAQAGSPEAAHDTHDLQPELKATAVFSR